MAGAFFMLIRCSTDQNYIDIIDGNLSLGKTIVFISRSAPLVKRSFDRPFR